MLRDGLEQVPEELLERAADRTRRRRRRAAGRIDRRRGCARIRRRRARAVRRRQPKLSQRGRDGGRQRVRARIAARRARRRIGARLGFCTLQCARLPDLCAGARSGQCRNGHGWSP
ncbi:protein of unknown function [Burkholderia multivorans]